MLEVMTVDWSLNCLSVLVSHEFKTEKKESRTENNDLEMHQQDLSLYLCAQLASLHGRCLYENAMQTVGCAALLQVKCTITGTFSPFSYNISWKNQRSPAFSDESTLDSIPYCGNRISQFWGAG